MYYVDCTGFPCDNGECTTSVLDRCDETKQCSDGSDESNCGKLQCNSMTDIIIAIPHQE